MSVASIITAKNGVCSDARIALGAVAPAPMRARAAELAIKGKSINEKSAAEAAQAALAAVLPLGMNQYKVDIARDLDKEIHSRHAGMRCKWGRAAVQDFSS